MATRLITKTTGKILATTHCRMFYMAKGNNIDGKPYGIIPTTDDDPLGLVFDEEKLTVSVKPGQAYCYGRQCVVSEKTQVFDMHEYKETEKGFCVVYLRIDLSDIVDQDCRFLFTYGSNTYPDMSLMFHSNLLKRGNGIYDVPIGRFVFSPGLENGIHFSKYEKTIPVLDQQSRATTDQTDKIGLTKAEKMLKGSKFVIRASKAENAQSATHFGDTEVLPTLDGVWTGKRIQFGKYNAENFLHSTTIKYPLKIDKTHLQRAYISGKSFVTSSPRRDTYVLFPAKHWPNGKNINIFAKLSFNRLIFKKDVLDKTDFLLGIIMRDVYLSEGDAVFFDVTLIETSSIPSNFLELAAIRITNEGITWIGTFNRNDLNNFKYQVGLEIGQPSIVGSTKDGKWFYGNQGNGIYADFLYKGDVNVS